MRLFFFCLLLSLHVFGQNANQPQKESHLDIRTNAILFSIADLDQGKVIWLERTANLEYFLRMKHNQDVKILKISSQEALKIDREFASRFLKCQYEFSESPKDCDVMLRLKMKTEDQEICKKEDQKAREISPFYQKLDKLF